MKLPPLREPPGDLARPRLPLRWHGLSPSLISNPEGKAHAEFFCGLGAQYSSSAPWALPPTRGAAVKTPLGDISLGMGPGAGGEGAAKIEQPPPSQGWRDAPVSGGGLERITMGGKVPSRFLSPEAGLLSWPGSEEAQPPADCVALQEPLLCAWASVFSSAK